MEGAFEKGESWGVSVRIHKFRYILKLVTEFDSMNASPLSRERKVMIMAKQQL